MPQASHKITKFPGGSDELEPATSLPASLLTQDCDPTREIRTFIEELQATAREARLRQRLAEQEREQLRTKLLALQEPKESGVQANGQLKSLTRERDMLLEQQSQYGPVISDLKQRLKAADLELQKAVAERDAAVREKTKSQRPVGETDQKREEMQRQRDAAIRQRELFKQERDEAFEKAAAAKKNLADVQKTLAEARQELASTKKKGEGEISEQLASVRAARDGMAAQIQDLKKRICELEDEAAEAGYAREAAERIARESQAQVTDIQGVLEAAASGDEAQKIEQLEASVLELQNQLAVANESNKSLSESEASLKNDLAALRGEVQASVRNGPENSALLDEARTSLVAAQKQIEAIIRDRDAIKEQLSANAVQLEAQLNEQSAEVARLRRALSDNDGKNSERQQMEAHFEKRRLDMIDLCTQLENAHREIRNLSASLAEARLQAKLAGRSVAAPPTAAPAGNRPASAQESGPGREEIMAMRRCFQTFSRDQKQLGMLGELETYALQIADLAMEEGRPILHRIATAFASLLGDLLEVPDQVTQTSLRTLNQTIEFIALQISDPEIEGCLKLSDARVYVVDDDQNTCSTVLEALKLVGLQASFALYSSAAVAELAANGYDLIILDVHLPELDGFELCSHIRTMALHAETPIFFITGDTSLENRVKSSLRGGNEFIAKPFSIQEIALKALKSVITGQLRKR